jgi:ribose-phosphate pyrophosphokinase
MTSNLELFSFPESIELAQSVGRGLGLAVRPVEIHRFPDGESLVRLQSRDPSRAMIFRALDHPNEKIFEVILAADALRRQGVEKIGLVAPYLGYMRQDRVFEPGEPISQQVLARLFDSAFDDVLTVEAHLHRIQRLSEVFSISAESVSASAPIADWLRQKNRQGVLIGPDAESEPWIRSIAQRAGRQWVLASKKRYSDQEVRIDLPALPPETQEAWIVDDIASSGATLETLIRILKQRGLRKIGAIVVHALFEQQTSDRLTHAGLDQLVSTDSITHPTNEIPLAPLLSEQISHRMLQPEAS